MNMRNLNNFMKDQKGVTLTEVLAAIMVLMLVFTAAIKSVGQAQQRVSDGRRYEALAAKANEAAIKGDSPISEKETDITFTVGKKRYTMPVMIKEYGIEKGQDGNELNFPVILRTMVPVTEAGEADHEMDREGQ
jgi:Tfp pilus assembly protein PilX